MTPYDIETLPTYEHIHATVVPVLVDPASLHPTQPVLVIEHLLRLAAGGRPEGPDDCAHVVEYRGRRYVHNGHHRWMLALLRGELLWCRVVSASCATRAHSRCVR